MMQPQTGKPQPIKIDKYVRQPDVVPPRTLMPEQIEPVDVQTMASIGVDVADRSRPGTYIQRDFFPICLLTQSRSIELLPIGEALQRYDWLRERYYWRAVPSDLDEYTAGCAAAPQPQGFFLRIKQGVKVPRPVQACLYMTRGDILQMVHNVVIVEAGAEIQLITGCAIRHGIDAGTHWGITENYVGANARLISTMVHRWSPTSVVRPRTGTIIEAGGAYLDTYCSLHPAGDIQANPRTWLNGPHASARHLTVILGAPDSRIDTGGEVYLNGEDSSAELAHRAVCTGGHIYQRGLLVGNARCRAHVDCAGMVLDHGKGGFIESVPGLKALHAEARMSHEASIGKIAPEQVEYLQSRGLEEREAIALIVRGFLGVDKVGLGPELDARITEIVTLAGHGEERNQQVTDVPYKR